MVGHIVVVKGGSQGWLVWFNMFPKTGRLKIYTCDCKGLMEEVQGDMRDAIQARKERERESQVPAQLNLCAQKRT